MTKSSTRVLLAVVAAVAVLPTTGCRDRGDHDGHDHGAHGHGHDGPGHGGDARHGPKGGAHEDRVTLAPEAIERSGIAVEKASRRPLVPTCTTPARVALDMDATAHVGVPVRGRVRELRVKRGDTVEKGAVLFLLDSPELGAAQNDLLELRVAAGTIGPTVEIARSALPCRKR